MGRARFFREQEVAGSNPVAPTKFFLLIEMDAALLDSISDVSPEFHTITVSSPRTYPAIQVPPSHF
jgi:hypothetical protein